MPRVLHTIQLRIVTSDNDSKIDIEVCLNEALNEGAKVIDWEDWTVGNAVVIASEMTNIDDQVEIP